jgi:F-type H+-transporting ATPase subunit b
MNNYLYIFNIFASQSDSKTFGFNTNFLEANVINIVLLVSGLIYVLKNFLGSALTSRQEKVLVAIQESEERLKQSAIRLKESKKQLAQTQIIVSKIKKEAEITAQKVRDSILAQGKLDIEKLTASGKNNITNAEKQIKKQIQQQIIALAIHRVTIQLKSQINVEIQSTIIDSKIVKLGIKI